MSRSFALALIVAGGCTVSNGADNGMVVLGNTALTSGTQTCMFSGLPGQPMLSHGIVAVISPNPYVLTPLVQSRITGTTDQTIQRSIQLQGANVSLAVASTSLQSGSTFSSPTITLSGTNAQFQTLTSGTLEPNSTINVQVSIIPVSALASINQQAAAAAADNLRVEVVATVTMFGTLAGSHIEAAPFKYPITVCSGSGCVATNRGACPLKAGTTLSLGNPCNPYQDGTIDCCASGTSLTCPASLM
jgi:hypothetical protein